MTPNATRKDWDGISANELGFSLPALSLNFKCQDPEEIKAEFLLEIALQSLAGGNIKAAFMRLKLCQDQLLKISEGGQPRAEIAVQLGAVCGSQVGLTLSPSS